MTWDEIETIIKRGGLTDEQQKEYWDCLFLDEKQVLELLGYVREKAEHPFIHAAIGFAALPASLLMGWLWTQFGVTVAFDTGAGLAGAAAMLLALLV